MAVGSSSAGSNGQRMLAVKSLSLDPKNCMTSAGSTPASSATERIVVAVNPRSPNWRCAAAGVAAFVRVWPGRRPVRVIGAPGASGHDIVTVDINAVDFGDDHVMTAFLPHPA